MSMKSAFYIKTLIAKAPLRFKRKILRIVIAVAVVLLSLFLILFLNKTEYGLILMLVLVIGYLIWKAFIQRREEAEETLLLANSEKDKEIENLRRQLENERQSTLNITDVRNVCKYINQEVEFLFYRPVIRSEEYDGNGYTFKGVAEIKGKAFFGIDFDKLKYKIESGVLYVGQEQSAWAISCEFTPTWLFRVFLKDSKVVDRFLFGKKHEGAKEDDYSIRRLPEISTELMSSIQRDISQRRIAELVPNIEQTKKTLQIALQNKYPNYTIKLVDVEPQDASFQSINSLSEPELSLLDSRLHLA